MNFGKYKLITKITIIAVVLTLSDGFSFSDGVLSTEVVRKAVADTAATEEQDDYDLYQKYQKCQNYEKRKNYRRYKEYKDKYGFDDEKERAFYKDRYEKYKLFKENPAKYKAYGAYWDEYKRYRNYKEKYQEYKKYKKYKSYNKKQYGRDIYKTYCKDKYERGYKRYKAKQNSSTELNLGGGSLGPVISVGLFSHSSSSLATDPLKVKANKNYAIKDGSGNLLATIPGATETRVTNATGESFKVYGSIAETIVAKQVIFEAADGSDNMVFDINKPDSSFDQYRGKIRIRQGDNSQDIWVINTLPLEQYTWGMGEITGTGPLEFSKLMTVAYRTYGYWKIKYSTKYAAYDFQVKATADSQVYYGYDWEIGHPNIQKAAIETRGKVVMYQDRIAITPYSSWTDGRTRSWEERWGSDNYPWCKSVSDPYGKHPTMSTTELVNAGNHMVGLSAHGALDLADDHNWDWDRIMKYYYSGISFSTAY